MVFIKKLKSSAASIAEMKHNPFLHNFKPVPLLGECKFNNDFNTKFMVNLPYVVVAVIAAFIGLSNNDPTIVIASMLFSPIGSEILRSSVGMIIGDYTQFGLGVLNHLLYVLLIWVMSYIGGLLLDEKEVMQIKYTNSKPEIGNNQMLARTQWSKSNKGIITSILLAVSAGVVLALSHSNKDASMLVGIGIGASLLPPLVNSGILAAISTKSKLFDYSKMSRDSLFLWLINYVLMFLTMTTTFKLFCKN